VLLTDGTPILFSRTGFTGEFGFEIFVDPLLLATVWQMLLESGREFGLTPCGLAARDSLRAGAGLPLSHQDIGAWPFIKHPWHFALPFNSAETHFTKPFIGDKSLLNITQPEYTYPVAGDNVCKVCSADQSVVLDADDTAVDFSAIAFMFSPPQETGLDATDAIPVVETPMWFVGINTGPTARWARSLEKTAQNSYGAHVFEGVPTGLTFMDVYGSELARRLLDFLDTATATA